MFNQIFFLATNLKYSVNIGLVKYVIIFEKYNLNLIMILKDILLHQV